MAGPRIALLLSGLPSDLTASVSAVQVAGRTESRLFVIRAPGAAGEDLDSCRFVSEFATLEGVKTSCHLLANSSESDLVDFLLANSITWLVVGACPDESRPEQDKWLARLRDQLRAAPNRFCPELQIIVAQPLVEKDLARVISQSKRLSQLAAGQQRKHRLG